MKRLKSKKGVTLVELLVTFALFAIFMAAAAAVLTPCTRIYLKVKYLSYAQNVSSMVMTKVEGELAGATQKININADKVEFVDSGNLPLYIETKNSLLNIHYRGEIDDATGDIKGAVDWGYDKKAYQGFQISSMKFSKIPGNNVEIILELYHPLWDIKYSTTKVIECYNLADKVVIDTQPVETDDKEYFKADTGG